MAGRPATFKEADIKRAVRSVQAAGLEVGAVELLPDGMIRIVSRLPGAMPEHKPVDAPRKRLT